MAPSARTHVYLVRGAYGAPGATVVDAWQAQALDVTLVEAGDEWWTSIAADEAPAIVADAAWLPGPRLVERLCTAAAHGGDVVVDARVLPIETTRVGEPESDVEPRPRVSAACCLLPAGRLAEVAHMWRLDLGAGRGAALADWAASTGADVVVEPTATVMLPVRVDGRGVPTVLVEPADSTPFEAPANLHPAALPATSLWSLLDDLGLSLAELPVDVGYDRPFLSIVTRTQGTRLQCLAEVLACVAAQTNRDFELLLMCHRVSTAAREGIRTVVAEQPQWLRDRVRLVDVERAGRSAPLNDGFAAARGRYIAILDDDDTVLGHWIETFADLERQGSGPVLRAATLRQDVVPLENHDELIAVPVGDPFPAWPSTFDLVDHLRVNHTPCMGAAFPRGVFHDLGVTFDESLPANEDWDFLVRSAGLVGARSSDEVTSIYRWWLQRASSRELHTAEEWDRARDRVLAKLDATVKLLPTGSSTAARAAFEEWTSRVEELRLKADTLGASQHEIILQLGEVGSAHERTMQAYETMKERAADAKRRLVRANRRLARVRERMRRRTRRFREHRALMREADDLLQLTGTRHQYASVFDMTTAQLKALIADLQGQGDDGLGSLRRGRPAADG